MTTIVTTASKNYTVMVADRGITSDLMHPEMKKIVKQGTWLIGVSGEDRICDVIQYVVRFPKVPASLIGGELEDWIPWVVTRVVPTVQKAIQENLSKESWSIGDSEILLVTHGKAFLLSGTLGVTVAEPYWAIGSGAQVAVGSLAGKNNRTDWKTLHANYAREAVEIAERHDPFTRGEVSGYKSYPSGKLSPI